MAESRSVVIAALIAPLAISAAITTDLLSAITRGQTATGK